MLPPTCVQPINGDIVIWQFWLLSLPAQVRNAEEDTKRREVYRTQRETLFYPPPVTAYGQRDSTHSTFGHDWDEKRSIVRRESSVLG